MKKNDSILKFLCSLDNEFTPTPVLTNVKPLTERTLVDKNGKRQKIRNNFNSEDRVVIRYGISHFHFSNCLAGVNNSIFAKTFASKKTLDSNHFLDNFGFWTNDPLSYKFEKLIKTFVKHITNGDYTLAKEVYIKICSMTCKDTLVVAMKNKLYCNECKTKQKDYEKKLLNALTTKNETTHPNN